MKSHKNNWHVKMCVCEMCLRHPPKKNIGNLAKKSDSVYIYRSIKNNNNNFHINKKNSNYLTSFCEKSSHKQHKKALYSNYIGTICERIC